MPKPRTGRWKARLARWKRFAAWTAPRSARERRTRFAWLSWAMAEARSRGLLHRERFDAPEVLAHRRRVREALDRIRG